MLRTSKLLDEIETIFVHLLRIVPQLPPLPERNVRDAPPQVRQQPMFERRGPVGLPSPLPVEDPAVGPVGSRDGPVPVAVDDVDEMGGAVHFDADLLLLVGQVYGDVLEIGGVAHVAARVADDVFLRVVVSHAGEGTAHGSLEGADVDPTHTGQIIVSFDPPAHWKSRGQFDPEMGHLDIGGKLKLQDAHDRLPSQSLVVHELPLRLGPHPLFPDESPPQHFDELLGIVLQNREAPDEIGELLSIKLHGDASIVGLQGGTHALHEHVGFDGANESVGGEVERGEGPEYVGHLLSSELVHGGSPGGTLPRPPDVTVEPSRHFLSYQGEEASVHDAQGGHGPAGVAEVLGFEGGEPPVDAVVPQFLEEAGDEVSADVDPAGLVGGQASGAFGAGVDELGLFGVGPGGVADALGGEIVESASGAVGSSGQVSRHRLEEVGMSHASLAEAPEHVLELLSLELVGPSHGLVGHGGEAGVHDVDVGSEGPAGVEPGEISEVGGIGQDARVARAQTVLLSSCGLNLCASRVTRWMERRKTSSSWYPTVAKDQSTVLTSCGANRLSLRPISTDTPSKSRVAVSPRWSRRA
mmetsp:Transcript_21470/g.48774  ORF Transcript_21470/g.48774 Transcript_21470/m.48774 type:complete len:582 (+) Transcript_21470:49-1794(+)